MGISSINSSTSSALNGSTSDATQTWRMQALLASLQNQPTLLDALSESDGSSSGDILDLSSAGQSVADQLNSLLSSSSDSSTQQLANETTAKIFEKLRDALEAKGIDLSEQIDLQLDANGQVVVTSDHPQKAEIEAAINGDSGLKQAVTEYLGFMKTVAPSLTGSSSDSSSYLAQLWATYRKSQTSDEAADDSSSAVVTLQFLKDAYQAAYQTSSDEAATVLVSSS